MPRRIQVKRDCARVKNLQCRNHCYEYSKEQRRDFDDWRKVKMIGTVDGALSRIPGQCGHCQHNGLLNSSGPTELSAKNGRPHYAKQVQEVAFTLDT